MVVAKFRAPRAEIRCRQVQINALRTEEQKTPDKRMGMAEDLVILLS